VLASAAAWSVHRCNSSSSWNSTADESHQIFFCHASRDSTSLQSAQVESCSAAILRTRGDDFVRILSSNVAPF
jgi:hypothetical protein